MAILNNDWAELLNAEFDQPYYLQLRQFLIGEYRSKEIFPAMHDIYNALHYTPYAQTKVVILGQDPYHRPGQAHGLSFSVQPGVPPPPSLVNIYKELADDLGCTIPSHGYLKPWADQGVLLLNAVLTVQRGRANAHQGKGWEMFTNQVIYHLNERVQPVVFILWGKNAQQKQELITNGRHCVICSPHPSPFSADRGFFGSRPFSRANDFLVHNEWKPIDWQLPLEVTRNREEQ